MHVRAFICQRSERRGVINDSTMGLLTVLKKLKQKEKEMRILMLYVFALVYLFYISSLWLVYALTG